MNNQDTASKVIARLTAQIGSLIKDNTVMAVIIEEQQAEIKKLQEPIEEQKPD